MLAKKLNVSVEYLETGRDLRESEDRELRLGDAELAIRFSDDTGEIEQQLEELRDEALAAGDRLNAARAEAVRGLASVRRGNHFDAVERVERSLEIHRPEPHLRPDLYAALGESLAALGAPDRAVRVFQNCLDAVREAAPNDTTIKTRFATLLSYALSDAGDYDGAAAVVRDLAAELTADASPYDRVRVYWAAARTSGLEGRSLEALDYIRHAIGLLEATDNTTQLARGRCEHRGRTGSCRGDARASPCSRGATRAATTVLGRRHAKNRAGPARGARRRRRDNRSSRPRGARSLWRLSRRRAGCGDRHARTRVGVAARRRRRVGCVPPGGRSARSAWQAPRGGEGSRRVGYIPARVRSGRRSGPGAPASGARRTPKDSSMRRPRVRGSMAQISSSCGSSPPTPTPSRPGYRSDTDES